MIKRIATALTLVLSVACASSPLKSLKSSSMETSSGGGVAVTSLRNAPDYIMLSAPNQVRTYDFSNAVGVRGLHIRGTMTSRGFLPAGDVQGNGKLCAEGKDWLSLSDLTVHTSSDGKTPSAPYLLGCATSSGFQPASRTIVTQ